MGLPRVLIVEDDSIIALNVEQVLAAAGFDVCGVATSQAEALTLADEIRPDFALVDIELSPGDGRVVAKQLFQAHHTAVVFATAQCDDVRSLSATGAVVCLPKPYLAEDVPDALRVAADIVEGHPPDRLPDHLIPLGRGAQHPSAGAAGVSGS